MGEYRVLTDSEADDAFNTDMAHEIEPKRNSAKVKLTVAQIDNLLNLTVGPVKAISTYKPTNRLHELGLATFEQATPFNRRTYRITEAGRAWLEANGYDPDAPDQDPETVK